MHKWFSKGGYQPTEPLPEFKIEEVTYGDGAKAYQVLELTLGGVLLSERREFWKPTTGEKAS